MPILTTLVDLTAAEILDQIAEHDIALVPALGLWVASADIKGDSVATLRRSVRSISAQASTPTAAVKALIEKLDGPPREEDF